MTVTEAETVEDIVAEAILRTEVHLRQVRTYTWVIAAVAILQAVLLALWVFGAVEITVAVAP